MTGELPDLLTGTEMSVLAWVGKAEDKKRGPRWQQVHFNKDLSRRFFGLEPGDRRSVTLEKLSSSGRAVERTSRNLVYSERNKNYKLEFNFGPRDLPYPPDPERPLIAVVEASYGVYRYRTFMPGDPGHAELQALMLAGSSDGGKGLYRRIVTLDDIEASWPQAALRGGV